MLLKLGNLSIEKFAKIVEAEFTKEELIHLNESWSQNASLSADEDFHIFEDPCISIHIGSNESDTLKIFVAANNRKEFNREISFHLDQEWKV